jgi:uncharacterized membrane protein YjjP (DUF1212 family)
MKKTESQHHMLEFLTELGKALTSSGISVVDIDSILERIASAYQVKTEILVLPTMLLIKLGDDESASINIANQTPGLQPLNQVSELYELIYQAENADIRPEDGIKRLKEILSEKHRFGRVGVFCGYILFCIGVGLLLQPSLEQLIASGVLGAVVGFFILIDSKHRFSLILPVIAAFLVSSLFFWGVKVGLITGSFIMLIPALAYFLPGADLTPGMFELASRQIISGSSRVIYGVAILFLLFFGVLLGMNVSGLPLNEFLISESVSTLGWWAPYLGVMILALGMYVFMSIRDQDLPWILLVLYIAFLGQQAGNYLMGGFLGAFIGSLLMSVSGTIIERYEHKTPSFVSILPAFWILVPGSLGFISLATMVGQDYFTAITNAILVALTIVAISLGLIVGAVITEPLKDRKII